MPAEVNGNYAVIRFERALVHHVDHHTYYACGDVVVTPQFVIVSGHYGEDGNFTPIVSKAIRVADVRIIDDRSVEPCDVHDKMDAEAEALMEKVKEAALEESSKN